VKFCALGGEFERAAKKKKKKEIKLSSIVRGEIISRILSFAFGAKRH